MSRTSKYLHVFGTALAVILVLSSLSSAVSAQNTVSRVGVTVVDEAGEPLEGVTVTATHEPTNFEFKRVTNKKGKVTLAFRNGALTYNLTLSLGDYTPVSTPLKPKTGTVTYHTYTLAKGSSPSTASEAEGTREIPLTPAQKIFNEGVTALQAEDLPTAKAKFLEALGMDADIWQAHSGLAAIYLEEKDYANAKASAEIIVEKDPGSGRGYNMLYEALSGLGETEAAEELLGKISELESSADAVPLIYNEGAEAIRMGDMARGQERLEKALSMDPELYPAVRLLSIVYMSQKDHAKAVEFSERYLAAKPGDVNVMKLRVDAYTALGDKEKADQAFQELAAADPKALIKGLFDAGQEQFNAGNTEAALDAFKKILAIDPEHGMTHYLIGLTYTNTGENAQAKTHLQKFIDLMPEHENAALAKEMLGFL